MYQDQIFQVIPQLKQIQYDTYTQLIYVDKALLALGFSSLINDNRFKYREDFQIEKILPTLAPLDYVPQNEAELKKIAYVISMSLGLFDAASYISKRQ